MAGTDRERDVTKSLATLAHVIRRTAGIQREQADHLMIYLRKQPEVDLEYVNKIVDMSHAIATEMERVALELETGVYGS